MGHLSMIFVRQIQEKPTTVHSGDVEGVEDAETVVQRGMG